MVKLPKRFIKYRVHKQMDGRTDSQPHTHTDGQTDRQPENIMSSPPTVDGDITSTPLQAVQPIFASMCSGDQLLNVLTL